MPSPAELAWLIPVLPLIGAAIVGLGLISFNRTVNRLRKPVALLLITSVGAVILSWLARRCLRFMRLVRRFGFAAVAVDENHAGVALAEGRLGDADDGGAGGKGA